MRFVLKAFKSKPASLLCPAVPRVKLSHDLVKTSATRQLSNMANVSPFSQAVVTAMRKLYPESLADKSFDNTGLLLEAPVPSHLPRKANSVLLTIDLTKAVADEAIEENHSVVVAYHPIIFRGLKSLTLDDSQQQSLLRLASHGISVYSPHTAVDIVPDGMADWLCDIVTGKVEPDPEPKAFTSPETLEQDPQLPSAQPSEPASETDVTTSEDEEQGDSNDAKVNESLDSQQGDPTTPKPKRPAHIHRTYSKPSYPSRSRGRAGQQDSQQHVPPSPIDSSPSTTFHHSIVPHTRSVITPSPSSAIDSANKAHASDATEPYYTTKNTGAGRLITFDKPQPLASLITRVAHATGTPKGFPVAIPQSTPLESIKIRTVGICPGSGAGVMRGCREPPDLVFTGEMSHHEALAVIERGGSVINLFHSNSERGYLDAVMRKKLEDELYKTWAERRHSNKNPADALRDIVDDESSSVVVSLRDRDPFGIVVLQESSVKGQDVG